MKKITLYLPLSALWGRVGVGGLNGYCARQSLEEGEESRSDLSNQKPLTVTRRV